MKLPVKPSEEELLWFKQETDQLTRILNNNPHLKLVVTEKCHKYLTEGWKKHE